MSISIKVKQGQPCSPRPLMTCLKNNTWSILILLSSVYMCVLYVGVKVREIGALCNAEISTIERILEAVCVSERGNKEFQNYKVKDFRERTTVPSGKI